MATTRYHFDERYRERARLRDGTEVELRLVRPDDRALLRRGFERLSETSRRLRFMGSKAALSDAELELLTVLDGEHRFAIGAVRPAEEGGEPSGLGIARFARLPEEPEVAEAAVTVVDSAQGLGLGSLLLRRLAAAARERGVRRFRGEMLLANEPMRQLLAEHTAATVLGVEGGVVRVLVELPSYASLMSGAGGGGHLVDRLLAYAARGVVDVRLGELLLKRG